VPTKKAALKLPEIPYFDHVQHTLAQLRRISIVGPITESVMGHVSHSLQYQQAQDMYKPIDIYLNSPGGSVIDGLAVYDSIMHTRKTTPVNITVLGACMSMGSIILQAGTERRAYPHAQFLLHEISYGLHGAHSEHEDFKKQADRLQKLLSGILVGRSKLTPTKLNSLIKRREYTISAQEALEVGLIDKIID
jgi:ATP-dependent Clp protease protease subunit